MNQRISIVDHLKKNCLIRCCFFLAFIMLVNLAKAQQNNESQNFIKTLAVEASGTLKQQNIFQLGEAFSVSFDDLNADERTYYYKIAHCDWDWTPSNLLAAEYIDGFAENQFLDFSNSFNTLVGYTHYTVSFPNENTRIKISGNYLISILDEEGVEVVNRKIVIYEPSIDVAISVTRPVKAIDFQSKQAIKFALDFQQMFVNNPSKEIIPIVVQNNQLAYSKRQYKHQYVLNNKFIYQNNPELEFGAGNEFLHFDTKSTINTNITIRSIKSLDHCHIHLYTDVDRSERTYRQLQDINGGFLVRNVDFPNALPTTEADYVDVHFSLKTEIDKSLYDIYVIGGFNDWQLQQENKMTYNKAQKKFETSMLLKQGYYNYDYLAVDKNGNIGSKSISGSFFQTENDYKVVVYYKQLGARYTRVIGMGNSNSLNAEL